MSEELESWKHSYRLLEEERQRIHFENARLREALGEIMVLHANESTDQTCCEMADIARAALEGK